MSATKPLENRVAIVTGGARGIGRAIVEEFIGLGAKVVIADNGVSISGDEPDGSVAKNLARTLEDSAAAFSQDISRPGVAQSAVDFAVKRFGALDIVVNNAAILRDSFIFKAERENWEKVIQVNLTGAFALLAAATPLMRDAVKNGRAPGRIVNIVSSAGLYGNFGQSAYASSKAALVALTRVVAMDLARSKVTCNAVAPFAATRVTESIKPANDEQAAYKERALKIPASHVARLVAYLCLPATEVTGQLFGVRGREVFLFSQPRPVARIAAPEGGWDLAALDQAVKAELAGKFTDMKTDLEVFNTEPLV